MAKSQETFSKKEKEKKRQKKKQEKQLKKEERRASAKDGNALDDMIAYVDEFGNIVDTPPDPTKKKKIKAENIEIGVPKMIREEEEAVKKGRVEFFNTAKGFGFIKEIDSREKFFVHVNGLIDEIREGDVVSFELEQGLKGLNAVKVQRTK